VTAFLLNTLVIKPQYLYKRFIWTVNVQQMTSVFTSYHKGLTLLCLQTPGTPGAVDQSVTSVGGVARKHIVRQRQLSPY